MRKFSKKYIILLCILTILISLWVSSLRTEHFNIQKRFALIIRGEAFRNGGMGNRDHGNPNSYEEQKKACETHMQLIKKIESTGYVVDVYINSYNTKFNKDLESWYGGYLKKSRFHEKHLESQGKLVEDSIQLMQSQGIHYDALLILRIDLFLKEKFIHEYNPHTNTIQFVCILWSKWQKTEKGNPIVNDVMFHFPRRFFHKLYLTAHNHYFLDIEKLEHEKDYSLLTRNFHDSDSAKDFNPYYRMIARPENTTWFDQGKEYPRDYK